MAAPGLSNRRLSDKLRFRLLNECHKILDGDDEQAKKDLLMKMCHTLLPRLNEHTGEGGERLFPKPLLAGQSNVNPTDNSNQEAPGTEEAN